MLQGSEVLGCYVNSFRLVLLKSIMHKLIMSVKDEP